MPFYISINQSIWAIVLFWVSQPPTLHSVCPFIYTHKKKTRKKKKKKKKKKKSEFFIIIKRILKTRERERER